MDEACLMKRSACHSLWAPQWHMGRPTQPMEFAAGGHSTAITLVAPASCWKTVSSPQLTHTRSLPTHHPHLLHTSNRVRASQAAPFASAINAWHRLRKASSTLMHALTVWVTAGARLRRKHNRKVTIYMSK